ncbi:unnamed protein product [Medioppia subpectinata]|uniref:MD-2-related lipid-recognition domain-containing protein n=1 Tax=Medioppia subpectinata TaxID=1979941 RepID=A0A7R9PY92_9ACAR|nr:unnamed protein product [Medioppia subpectinata]CAG2105649.1 unnamed protein product [Medioppia subpectinata]
MKFIIVLTLSLAQLYGLIDCVEYTDCGSVDGRVTAIAVAGCGPGDEYCQLKGGKKASIDVKFISNVDTDKLTLVLIGYLGGSEVWSLKKDACGGEYNVKCPLKKGSHNEMKIAMDVPDIPLDIKVEIAVDLLDTSGQHMFCQRFPAEIHP